MKEKSVAHACRTGSIFQFELPLQFQFFPITYQLLTYPLNSEIYRKNDGASTARFRLLIRIHHGTHLLLREVHHHMLDWGFCRHDPTGYRIGRIIFR